MRRQSLVAAMLAALAGCADLRVSGTQLVWQDGLRLAATTVSNGGLAASPATALYFDGNENPESQNYRPQVQAEVPALAPGQSVTRLADFAPLARPENEFLGRVHGVTVRVDPKNLVRESSESNNVAEQPVPAPASSCIDFDALALNTTYGTPAGQAPGTVVLSQGGVRVSVETFFFVGSGSAFNHARVEAARPDFGAGRVLRVNNIDLDIDLSALAAPARQLVLRFADVGGSENLSVDGAPVPIHRGELVAAPATMGSAFVATSAVPITGGKAGALAVIDAGGGIGHVRVGGQELFLDDICWR